MVPWSRRAVLSTLAFFASRAAEAQDARFSNHILFAHSLLCAKSPYHRKSRGCGLLSPAYPLLGAHEWCGTRLRGNHKCCCHEIIANLRSPVAGRKAEATSKYYLRSCRVGTNLIFFVRL